MKKHLLLLLLFPLLLLTSCNTRVLGDYSHIHIQVNAGEPIYHYEIKSWKSWIIGSSAGGIEVQLKDGTSMFINGGYILYNSEKCPICNK